MPQNVRMTCYPANTSNRNRHILSINKNACHAACQTTTGTRTLKNQMPFLHHMFRWRSDDPCCSHTMPGSCPVCHGLSKEVIKVPWLYQMIRIHFLRFIFVLAPSFQVIPALLHAGATSQSTRVLCCFLRARSSALLFWQMTWERGARRHKRVLNPNTLLIIINFHIMIYMIIYLFFAGLHRASKCFQGVCPCIAMGLALWDLGYRALTHDVFHANQCKSYIHTRIPARWLSSWVAHLAP